MAISVGALVKQPMSLYFDMPIPNLRSYLGRQKTGISTVVRTTFAKDEQPQQVLEDWDRIMSPQLGKWPTLLQYEEELRAKVGPMSVMKPLSERTDSIDDYFRFAQADKPLDDAAIKLLVKEWGALRGARLRSRQATLDRMHLNTNSGSPYFTRKASVVDRLLPFDIQRVGDSDFKMVLPEWNGLTCAVLGWRGQEGGPSVDDVKQRVIWMYPFALNVAELQAYQVLIESCQAHNFVPSWNGNDYVDIAITKLMDTKGRDDLIVCTDFSAFDQHFNSGCQKSALAAMSAWFSDKEWDYWAENIYPAKFNIPLCIQPGMFVSGHHGMGSGSGGTNPDETVFHKGLQLEAALRNGSVLNANSQCLGDDGCLSYPGITVDDVVASYTSHGLEMNPSKQYASAEDCTYLRRWHHRDYRQGGICVGVYSTMRALGRLMYQERFIDPDKWGPKAIAMRQLSIIENCRYHPSGEDFVKFCIKRDKYRLGLDIPGFMSGIDKIFHESEANDTLYVSYSSTYNNPTPPSQWWVVQTLKRLG